MVKFYTNIYENSSTDSIKTVIIKNVENCASYKTAINSKSTKVTLLEKKSVNEVKASKCAFNLKLAPLQVGSTDHRTN